jgi:hypothetical protein
VSDADRNALAETSRIWTRLKGSEERFGAAIAADCFGFPLKAVTLGPSRITPGQGPTVPVHVQYKELRDGKIDDSFDIALQSVEGDDQFRILSPLRTARPCPFLEWSWIPGLAPESTATPRALAGRLAAIVTAADKSLVAQFENGQLHVTMNHGVATADTLVDGNLRFDDFVPQAFDAVPSLQGITYSEFATIVDGKGHSETKKIGEFFISRSRSKSIKWQRMTPRQLVSKVDKAWRLPGFRFDPGVE